MLITHRIFASSFRRAPLTIIFLVPFLLSCSMSFDLPWDKKAADTYQKKSATVESPPAQSDKPLPISSNAGDEGRKWTRYMTDDDDIRYFLDKEAIVRSSNNTMQMWRKREFPPGSAQHAIVTLDEFDCAKARHRTLELHVTYSDGSTGRSSEASRWAKIYSNSSEEYLLGEQCK